MSHTIAVVAKLVNAVVVESSPESLGGKVQDTRKNPHVIDVGFEQELPVSYLCIMWMVISTIQH
jgi:hypothetical protein